MRPTFHGAHSKTGCSSSSDRGKKDRAILGLLNQHHVQVLFVYDDLRAAPPHHLVGALLSAEAALD